MFVKCSKTRFINDAIKWGNAHGLCVQFVKAKNGTHECIEAHMVRREDNPEGKVKQTVNVERWYTKGKGVFSPAWKPRKIDLCNVY
jgi:hypothetical protein